MSGTAQLTGTVYLPDVDALVQLRALQGVEQVSRAFEFRVDVVAGPLDLDALRAQQAQIDLIDSTGTSRHVSGLIETIDMVAHDEAMTRYRIRLLPAHAMLRHRTDYRIFQEVTVQDIITELLEEAGLGQAVRWSLMDAYQTRAICIQYGENTWDFICRLLEDEGICFAFEHDADGHTMVIFDDSTGARS